jgi:hypothetical protein
VPGPSGGRDREYVARRMIEEIGAAVNGASAIAASRHVELASLYARRLRGAERRTG